MNTKGQSHYTQGQGHKGETHWALANALTQLTTGPSDVMLYKVQVTHGRTGPHKVRITLAKIRQTGRKVTQGHTTPGEGHAVQT